MKENEKLDKSLRNTISLGKILTRNLKNENVDIRTRIASLSSNKLLDKFIPKLKPLMTNINPSPIALINKEEIKIEDENFKIESSRKASKEPILLKIKSLGNNEEINKSIENSDEDSNHKLSCDISYYSDTESKERENKLKKNNSNNKNINDKIDNNITTIKKNVNYCIKKLRRKMDKIKNKIKRNKYKDDSNIINFSYTQYFAQHSRNKYVEKIINKIKFEDINEFWKGKNKTVNNSNDFNPPILGFLKMNEECTNSTFT